MYCLSLLCLGQEHWDWSNFWDSWEPGDLCLEVQRPPGKTILSSIRSTSELIMERNMTSLSWIISESLATDEVAATRGATAFDCSWTSRRSIFLNGGLWIVWNAFLTASYFMSLDNRNPARPLRPARWAKTWSSIGSSFVSSVKANYHQWLTGLEKSEQASRLYLRHRPNSNSWVVDIEIQVNQTRLPSEHSRAKRTLPSSAGDIDPPIFPFHLNCGHLPQVQARHILALGIVGNEKSHVAPLDLWQWGYGSDSRSIGGDHLGSQWMLSCVEAAKEHWFFPWPRSYSPKLQLEGT